ncbi:MAG: hypothetical protein QM652_00425 [Legionella sp.]|uniref:hypothetical protein n=1 Tax=Legionella sp. TaxID=459 RepID=UPI0039E65636
MTKLYFDSPEQTEGDIAFNKKAYKAAFNYYNQGLNKLAKAASKEQYNDHDYHDNTTQALANVIYARCYAFNESKDINKSNAEQFWKELNHDLEKLVINWGVLTTYHEKNIQTITTEEDVKETYEIAILSCEDISDVFADGDDYQQALIWMERCLSLHKRYNFPIPLRVSNGYLNLLHQQYMLTRDTKYLLAMEKYINESTLNSIKTPSLKALEFLGYQLIVVLAMNLSPDNIKKSCESMIRELIKENRALAQNELVIEVNKDLEKASQHNQSTNRTQSLLKNDSTKPVTLKRKSSELSSEQDNDSNCLDDARKSRSFSRLRRHKDASFEQLSRSEPLTEKMNDECSVSNVVNKSLSQVIIQPVAEDNLRTNSSVFSQNIDLVPLNNSITSARHDDKQLMRKTRTTPRVEASRTLDNTLPLNPPQYPPRAKLPALSRLIIKPKEKKAAPNVSENLAALYEKGLESLFEDNFWMDILSDDVTSQEKLAENSILTEEKEPHTETQSTSLFTTTTQVLSQNIDLGPSSNSITSAHKDNDKPIRKMRTTPQVEASSTLDNILHLNPPQYLPGAKLANMASPYSTSSALTMFKPFQSCLQKQKSQNVQHQENISISKIDTDISLFQAFYNSILATVRAKPTKDTYVYILKFMGDFLHYKRPELTDFQSNMKIWHHLIAVNLYYVALKINSQHTKIRDELQKMIQDETIIKFLDASMLSQIKKILDLNIAPPPVVDFSMQFESAAANCLSQLEIHKEKIPKINDFIENMVRYIAQKSRIVFENNEFEQALLINYYQQSESLNEDIQPSMKITN